MTVMESKLLHAHQKVSNNNKMKQSIVVIFLLLISFTFYSQRFENAVGLRGGYGSGITFKHNMGDFTIEAIGAFRSYYTYLGVLGEFYRPLDVELPGDFNLFFGGGAHFGHQRYITLLGVTPSSQGYIGLDGIIGLE